jgi:hypothetical protein
MWTVTLAASNSYFVQPKVGVSVQRAARVQYWVIALFLNADLHQIKTAASRWK